MKKKERILVILNPSSGIYSKDVATSIIFKKLREHFSTVSIINSNSPSHGFEITKDTIDLFDIFTAFGGDGTINSIASALVNTDKTLGILAGGSGNGLVRNLNIPLSWRRDLDVLIYGKDTYIDVGKINGKYFFNVAGIGLDGLISKKIELESKSRGIAPYIYYALKGYFEMPYFHVSINADGKEFEEEIMIAAFANFKQYGGKAIIAPFASPRDGLLDLCIIKKFSILKETLNIQRLFTGNIHKFQFYSSYKFKNVKIKSLDRTIPLTIDGEYGGKEISDYEISVLPLQIKIRVPK